MTAAKPQNTAWAVDAFILLMPKLSAKTKPSGDSMTIHISAPPPKMICIMDSDCAVAMAMMPVSAKPDAI